MGPTPGERNRGRILHRPRFCCFTSTVRAWCRPKTA